jgi:hypothetical protein
LIRKVSLFFATALLGTFCSAGAQQTPPPTFLDKQLSRLDLGISAAALLNQTVSGTVLPTAAPNAGQLESDEQSNTVGALVNIHYVVKPLVGIEFNYLYSRYTENYSWPSNTAFGVQTQADEITLGYIVHPKINFFGLQPFVSAGAGSTEFKPTAHGGESLPTKARATYYYSIGVQDDISPHFGLRAGFRQTFFLAPDFGQNYLTTLQHTTSYQPTGGFYLRF